MTFNPFRILCVTVQLICGALAISIIIYGIFKSCSHRKLQMLKPFLITYYITCILWITGIIGYTLFQILPYNRYICSDFNLINSVFGAAMGFSGYLLGLIGIYFLFLLRLKYSFQDSILKLSNTKYYMLSSGIVIQFALVAITAYYYIIFRWDIGLIISYSTIIINTIYSLSLLVLFLRNICRLQQYLRFSVNAHKRDMNTPPTETNVELTVTVPVPEYNQNELISVTSTKESMNTIHSHHKYNDLSEMTVKLAICASIAFIFTIIVNFMSFYRGFIVEDTFDLLMFHVTLNVMDCFVTVICLHLQFSYSTLCYIKFCKCLRLPLKSYVLSIFDEQNNVRCKSEARSRKIEKESIELPRLQKSITTMSGAI